MSIALLTAIGLLQAGASAELSACTPRGADDAVVCLDRRLPAADRKAILAAPYVAMDDQFIDLRERIASSWLATDRGGLRAELRRD